MTSVFSNFEIKTKSYHVDANGNAKKAKAAKWNRLMHTINGNLTVNQYSVMQINTGNSFWNKNDMLMLCTLSKSHPDIIIISKSNYVKTPINDFEFHDRFSPI